MMDLPSYDGISVMLFIAMSFLWLVRIFIGFIGMGTICLEFQCPFIIFV